MLEKYLNRIEFDSYEDFYENFKVNVPQNFNFAYDVIDVWAAQEPERQALVWCDEQGAERNFTFRELKYYSDKAANFFLGKGIKKDDKVMLILKRRYEFWICMLALHKIGAIPIPATHQLKEKDIIYRVNSAGVKMIVAVDGEETIEFTETAEQKCETLKLKAMVHGHRDGWIDFTAEVEQASDKLERIPNSSDDPMLLYFTSGTTGYPKMVLHTYSYPLGHIVTAKYWQRVQPESLHLTVSDTGWAKCAWGKIYGQWLAGAVVFVYDFGKFVPKDLLTVISKYKIATFCAPPTIYRYLIKEDLSNYDLSSLKHCATAGEPLNPEVFRQFQKATGIAMREAYGQTEMTPAMGTYPWLEPKPGSMGKPSPGYHIEIVDPYDENLRVCEIGEVGEIVVRIDQETPVGLFKEYYKDPEANEDTRYGGYYHTKDTAWKDEDGYFWFVGRTDDVIKSSGYRIGPFEVESVLMEHPAVLECAITAVPDDIRGQIVKATIVLSKGYTPSETLIKELQQHVKDLTAPYKYPRIVEFVDELPKTISGKIKRVEIRQNDAK